MEVAPQEGSNSHRQDLSVADWRAVIRAGREGTLDIPRRKREKADAQRADSPAVAEAREANTQKEQLHADLDALREKLKSLGGDVTKRQELRKSIAEAEELFERVRDSQAAEEIASYQKKHKIDIRESLDVARHLADVYDQIATWGDDRRLEDNGEMVPLHPIEAAKEAKARQVKDAEFRKKLEEARKAYARLDEGRTDKEALDTEGLEADDLTLPYAKRLAFLENKIIDRFTKARGSKPTPDEIDQLVYGTKHGPSPLSRTERVGQWFRHLGEVTLGNVFDRLADTSLTQAVADYRALEDQYTQAERTYLDLEQQKVEREAERERIQARANAIDPSKQAERIAQIQARSEMETPTEKQVKTEGRKLSKREAEIEKKRRILSRQQLDESNREVERALVTAEVRARSKGDKAKLKEIAAFRKGAVDQEENGRALAETLSQERIDVLVGRRMREWRQEQRRAFMALEEGALDPDSDKGKELEDKVRNQVIAELQKTRDELFRSKDQEYETITDENLRAAAKEKDMAAAEDTFFGGQDTLGARREKAALNKLWEEGEDTDLSDLESEDVDLSGLEGAPKSHSKSLPRADILSDSDRYTLKGAGAAPSEHSFDLGVVDIPESAQDLSHTLGEGMTSRDGAPFVMGDLPPVTDKPFKLRPGELVLHDSSESAIAQKEMRQEAREVTEKIFKVAESLPPETPDLLLAQTICDQLNQYPIAWQNMPGRVALKILHNTRRSYEKRLREGRMLDRTSRNQLEQWIKVMGLIEELATKTRAEQEDYLSRLPKPNLAARSKQTALQPGKGVKKKEQERIETQKTQLVDASTGLLLAEFSKSKAWNIDTEGPLQVASNILNRLREKFGDEDVKAGLKQLLDRTLDVWEQLRDDESNPLQAEQMGERLIVASALANLLGLPISVRPKPERVSKPAAQKEEPSTVTVAERIPREELEMALENSLERHNLSIQKITKAIVAGFKKLTDPTQREQTIKFLKTSVLFRNEPDTTPIDATTVAQRYLESLAVYRAAKLHEGKNRKRGLPLLKIQLIDSLAPRLGIPTNIFEWDAEKVPGTEMIPASVGDLLDSYLGIPAAAQPLTPERSVMAAAPSGEAPVEERLESVRVSFESLLKQAQPLDMPKAVEKILNDSSIDWSTPSAVRFLKTLEKRIAALQSGLKRTGLTERARERLEIGVNGTNLLLQLANKSPEERRAHVARLEQIIGQLKQPTPSKDLSPTGKNAGGLDQSANT